MSRKILVISNQNNTKKIIESNATTRGELEQELNALGINTTEMSFFEGFSRTDLVDANSQLPAKVMYKGQEITDLIITLTPNSIKKVANGAQGSQSADRAELHRKVNEYGLKKDIKDACGKPYNMVSSDVLRRFIEEYEALEDEDKEEDIVEERHISKEEILINFLRKTKDEIEEVLKQVNPTLEDLRNLDLEELVKEFGK